MSVCIREKRSLYRLILLSCLFCFLLMPGGCLASGLWITLPDGEPAPAMPESSSGDFTGDLVLTFLGDCTLGGEKSKAGSSLSFAKVIEENGPAFPFRGLLALTEQDDLTVANLEVVLSDRALKKEKKKFCFIGKTDYTQILKLGSIESVSLANNHTHDYGNEGYADTREALESAKIGWVGTDACAVWQSDAGIRIGFLGVNYSLTGNYFKRFAAQAERLKELGCTILITLMHAGEEYSYSPPSPYQAQIVDRAIQVGSHLIIGHHPHVIQGLTIQQGVPVLYSLGNCSFGGTTFAKDHDAVAVQAKLHILKGALREIRMTFHPISITSDTRHNNYSPRLLSGEEAERVLKKMKKTTGAEPDAFNDDGSAEFVIPVN